ncbi:Ribonuclease MRP protein subunit RMP1 [Yarrowia sp. C11]|nr:Ribonuclease MRP protein subunit RMP1 [Yarrowia sp. E02]KAG5372157.1 Ribonuclease MRP protein subunit RMP1 [Yarrowia sp. C11]
MLSVYADQHREAPFPKKAYRAEIQKTVAEAGLGLQVSEFLSEAEIIHSLYYRYRNAHHCADWFGPFSMLHRRVSQVAKWIVDLHAATKKRAPRLVTAIKISIQKIQTRYLQPAFWSFYSVLALGQYVTVGFALLGAVARIGSLLAQVHPIPRTVGKVLDAAVKKGAEIMSDDIGEVLVRVSSDKPVKSDKPKKVLKDSSTKTAKVDKKSLMKMDIDDIFSSKKKSKKKSIEKQKPMLVTEQVEDDFLLDDDIEETPEVRAPAPNVKKVKVDNFFEDTKPKKKKPASLDDSLEPPKKKKKKLDSSDGIKKKKKSKKNAIDDIFG